MIKTDKFKLLFIPNWNGHLFLQDYEDKSITKLYELINFENKTSRKVSEGSGISSKKNSLNLIKIEKNNIENTNKIIEEEFSLAQKEFSKIISITGDHSNSYPLIKSYAKKKKDSLTHKVRSEYFEQNSKSFKLVIFDAHPDVEVSTDSITHEDYLRNLVDDKIVDPQNIYLFGIRTFSREEFEYLIDKKINFWSISDVLKNKNSIKKILKELSGDIYISIDIDVLDPDDAPGTYYREWCGLHIEELIEFIEILKPKTNHFDITEFYAEKDENEITQKNVLKLIDKIIN